MLEIGKISEKFEKYSWCYKIQIILKKQGFEANRI